MYLSWKGQPVAQSTASTKTVKIANNKSFPLKSNSKADK